MSDSCAAGDAIVDPLHQARSKLLNFWKKDDRHSQQKKLHSIHADIFFLIGGWNLSWLPRVHHVTTIYLVANSITLLDKNCTTAKNAVITESFEDDILSLRYRLLPCGEQPPRDRLRVF